jgi:(p)ppGpp synthase/HD superfamily hydrolase
MPLAERFSLALAYACQLHAQQTRKGTDIPYVAHLLAVAAIALEHGATEDEAIAALLHDAVEDQGGAAVGDEIRRRFGPAVAEIVEGCTDATTTPKPPWQARKEKFLTRLAGANRSVRLVTAADKLHNARSLAADHRRHGARLWDRFNGGKAGTLWYYRAVVDTLARLDRTMLVDELERAVVEIESLAAAEK